MLTDEQALKNFSANLGQAVEEREWDQIDLAKALQAKDESLDAAKMRVSRYVRGLHMPSGATLANIAEVLSVTVDWLLSSPRKKNSRHAG